MPAPKLFMFYVGGDCGNSNIELHDVFFCVGNAARDCYADLRKQWWGTPSSLHIDSWAEISHADGYDVELAQEEFKGKERLYFINLGGYVKNEFEEVHKNILVVASSQRDAIKKSIRQQNEWMQPHKDAIISIEKVLPIATTIKQHGLHVQLTESSENKPLLFTSKYIPLYRKKAD